MSNYEFEYNNEDFELIADTTIGELNEFDFVRVTVYPIGNIDNIVQINGQRAIFYSSLSETPFRINQTQFSQKIPENEELDIRLWAKITLTFNCIWWKNYLELRLVLRSRCLYQR